MTISGELTKLQNNLSDSYTAVSNKGGTIPQNQCFDNLPTAINSITTGITPSGTINITTNNTYDVTTYASAVVNVDSVNNTNLSVTPLTTAQSFTVSAPYTGYYTVSVSAVTSSIDSNIKASNIKSGVSILGVSGTVTELNGSSRSVTLTSASGQTFNPETGKNAITSITVAPNNQARTLTATTSQQTFTVGSGYSGNGTITLNAVTSAIDSNIKATNIKSGVNILGVNGSVVELAGETRSVSITSTEGNTFTPSTGKNGITSITVTPTNQNRTVTPSTSSQTLSVNSGYSGNGTITVNAVTSSIDANITAGNIKDGITILGVTGTFDPSPTISSLNVTPSTSAQTITATGGVDGYSPVNVLAVTSAIDANIQPQFIRNGVKILGVMGTYGFPLLSSLACSKDTTWYANESGELYGCGSGVYGQQGSGGTSNITSFTKRADNVVQVACTMDATWYVNLSGELYGCGFNSVGQQGSGTSGTTSKVTSFTKRADNVVQVACSTDNTNGIYDTTWYVNESGELYGCGSGLYGKQGSGGTSNITSFTKRADNVVQVACSSETTWYINSSGELYGCGRSNYGQQGSGGTSNITSFTKRADNVVGIACSEQTMWYINSSGELYGCGRSNYGQQGSGDTSNVTSFTKRADNVVQVACSSETTWYINSNGELYGCGYNTYGQQGSGDTSNVTSFTKRADNVVQVACSQSTTWYVTKDGELYGCGSGSSGQQGSGNTNYVTTFTKRADNVVKVACFYSATWYVNSSNEVYGCGSNGNGQQGNGTSGSGTDVLTFTKRN